MQEFLLKILSVNSNKKFGEHEARLIECVLKNCYLLNPDTEEVRPSCVAYKNCFKWGGTIENSLSSALLTLNSKHGPFSECYELIETYSKIELAEFNRHVIIDIRDKNIIPGFGNPIIKTRDGRCEEIRKELELYTNKYTTLSMTVEAVLKAEKQTSILSNLAFWVAASSHFLELPKTHASLLAILAFTICYTNKTRKWA